ncbi:MULTISPECIES: hypothetical protein [unclassified Endozoicomonas]|uniref:hypothetical protein n=1 Tax=unclassified Endozoicomonas TaxID=2644528 RepID=UPI00214958AD|nr:MULTISPECIES: hypothetical protein [unclassified Endozoicomonas]
MDIISTSLATIITAMSGSITDSYIENANAEITSRVIQHQGQDIYFEHQVWRIRNSSVCQNKHQKITEFSQCTLAAKAAFIEICQAHQHKNYKAHKAKSMVRMFCQAASNFKPTIAMIQPSSPASSKTKIDNTELIEAKQNCSALILESQMSNDPFMEAKRADACKKYKQLSTKQQ